MLSVADDVFTDQSFLFEDLIPRQVGADDAIPAATIDKGITGLGAGVDEDASRLAPPVQHLLLDRGLKVQELGDPADLGAKGLLQQGDQLAPPFDQQGVRLIQQKAAAPASAATAACCGGGIVVGRHGISQDFLMAHRS